QRGWPQVHRVACLRLRFLFADGLGQSPIDDQSLAVVAEHDVVWLQVAVEDALAVGIGDRIAYRYEPAQQLTQLQGAFAGVGLEGRLGVEAVDGVAEAVAL